MGHKADSPSQARPRATGLEPTGIRVTWANLFARVPQGLGRVLRLGAAAVLVMLTGCPPHPPEMMPFDPLPIAETIDIVNRNSSRLQGTLRATAGHARGHFTNSDGTRRKFDIHLERAAA